MLYLLFALQIVTTAGGVAPCEPEILIGGTRSAIVRDDVRVGVVSVPPASSCGLERHAFAEIRYVLRGAADVRLGEDRFPVRPGSVLLVPAGTPHEVTSRGEALSLVFFRWAPGGDRSVLHLPSTMTEPVAAPVQGDRAIELRRYERASTATPRSHTQIDDVDWTTNFGYDEALWKGYRYKPLVREPLDDWAGIGRDDVRMGLQELDPGASYPAHHHPSPEVYFVLEGQATWTLGTRRVPVGPGAAIFTPPETLHRIENRGPGALRWLYFWWAPARR